MTPRSRPRPRRLPVLLLGALAFAPAAARAQATGEALPRIRITDPNRDLLRLAIAPGVGDQAILRTASEVATRNFEIAGLFRVLDPTSFPADLRGEGVNFSGALWSQVGAQAVVKISAAKQGTTLSLDGRLFQVGRSDAAVLGKTYRGAELRPLVHAFCNDVIERLTGVRGVFGSRIVFAQTGSKGEIAAVGMDGDGLALLTKMGAASILPAISPSGATVAFTSFLRGGADLWIVPAGGGRSTRISKRPGMNTGAAWFADNATLAVTLSHEGSPDLYRIRAADGAIVKQLTFASSIETSPSLSPDGSQIAFVSNRAGTPQIYVMPAGGGDATRITFRGSYNQTPRFSPRADKPMIAFTGRDERGVFDVFTIDLKTGETARVTQNQGSNYDPAWSPDGRLLVYASSRGGLFVQNVETGRETQIWKGGAAGPSWGPAPR